MKYYYVYKTVNLINNKFYIGVHKSKTKHDKSYFGSGVALSRAIRKHGIENFSNTVLAYYESLEDAYTAEKLMVTEDLVNHKDCYNMIPGGKGGNPNNLITEENLERMRQPKSQKVKDKISATLKGKSYLTDEGRAKISQLSKGNQHAKGMTYSHTQQAKDAIGASKLGKKHSESTRIKNSINRKGKGIGINNAMSSQENRNKVRDSKIGLKSLYHPIHGKKLAHPDSDKWNTCIAEGYVAHKIL
jgi:group I intron endonuclease